MPPLLAVTSLEDSACLSLSRLLLQAFSKLEASGRRTRRQSGRAKKHENGVEEILDSLPGVLLELTTAKVLELLTSRVARQPSPCGSLGLGWQQGWYGSRVREGIAGFPGLATALR